jgi:thiosulfate/3-mercaptopyruvate sulfurtransferase
MVSSLLIVCAYHRKMFVHRALFTIQAMGHERERVHLMDGSLEEWEKHGGKLDKEPTKAIVTGDLDLKKPKYKASEPRNVVDIEEVKRIVGKGKQSDAVLVDVRSPERFLGSVDEPRPGLRLGHMPGAKNLFFYSLLEPDNIERFKPSEELRKLISEAGIDIETDKRIVISCGSGATACALAAALEVCGREPDSTYIYDGSWMEYGSVPDTIITKDSEE